MRHRYHILHDRHIRTAWQRYVLRYGRCFAADALYGRREADRETLPTTPYDATGATETNDAHAT